MFAATGVIVSAQYIASPTMTDKGIFLPLM